MAAILKSSKFISSFFRFAREANSIRLNNEAHDLFSRRLPLFNALSFKNFSMPSTKENADNLNKYFHRLDLHLRYQNNIYLKDIEDTFEAVKNSSSLSYHESLLLLKSCASPSLMMKSDERTQLIEKAMNLIENSGVKLNIGHYNTLLAIYIENEYDFSPSEFLQTLEKKQLEMNKLTYQRLLRAYCKKGDISNASNLLESMKDKGISLNEDIFNSLILGHCQVKDINSAEAILELMQAKSIEPSSTTYVNLLCGHAKIGQLDEMRKIMTDCETRGVVFFNNDILKIAYELAINKHFKVMNEILKKVKRTFDYDSQAYFYIIKLLDKNLDFAALEIYKTTLTPDKVYSDRFHGKYFIQYFAKYRSAEELFDFCEKFTKEDLISTPFALALRELISLDDNSKALKFFSLMKDNNLHVRPHYFWPIIIKASKEGNSSMLKVLMQMKKIGVKKNYRTCTRIVYPNYNFGSDWLTDIEDLQEAGVSMILIGSKLFESFLSLKKFEEAEKLTATLPLNSNPALNLNYLTLLENSLIKTQNVDFFVNVIYNTMHDYELNTIDSSVDSEAEGAVKPIEKHFVDQVIKELMKKCNKDLFTEVLQKMLEKKIGISPELSGEIQEKFNSPEIKNLLDKLTDENLHIELDENMLNSKKKYLERIVMNSEGKKTNKWFISDVNAMVNLVRSDNVEMALQKCEQLLQDHQDKEFSNLQKKKFKSFLMVLAGTGNYEATKSAYEIGMKLKIVQNRNFYPMVQALIVRGDLEEATDFFCENVSQTGCRSSWPSIVTKLIEVQNADLLQKVTNVMAKIASNDFSISMLLTQFAKLQKSREIKKLLESNGFSLPRKSLEYSCRWLLKNKSEEGIETLLSATKNIPEFDRKNILQFVLRFYIAADDSAKAEDIWSRIEEENIYPSLTVQKLWTDFLKKGKKGSDPFEQDQIQKENGQAEAV